MLWWKPLLKRKMPEKKSGALNNIKIREGDRLQENQRTDGSVLHRPRPDARQTWAVHSEQHAAFRIRSLRDSPRPSFLFSFDFLIMVPPYDTDTLWQYE